MPGRKWCIFLLALILAVMAIATPALADERYLVNQEVPRFNSHIVIHLIEVNVTDKYMGNIYPSTAPQETKWAHLIYQFENTGDRMEVGNIQYELIDSKGRVYKFNPNMDEYSGVEVRPHSKSDLRWNEIPIPRDAVLTRLHVFQGTNPDIYLVNETFTLQPIPTTGPAGTTPPSGSPSGKGIGCLSAVLPFGILGVFGIARLSRINNNK